jgi:hypothetical protein
MSLGGGSLDRHDQHGYTVLAWVCVRGLQRLDSIRNEDPEQRAHLTGLLVGLGETATADARGEASSDDQLCL